jgi:hypothetical protein
VHQLSHNGQGLVEHLITDAIAEVTEVILAGNGIVQVGLGLLCSPPRFYQQCQGCSRLIRKVCKASSPCRIWANPDSLCPCMPRHYL